MLFFSSIAWATWTIVAVDPDTGEVGAAGATCGPFVWMVAEVVPDHGAIVAQYDTNLKAKREGASMLAEGATPDEVITAITASSYDEDVAYRQYGVVAFSGTSAAYTGADNETWAGTMGDQTWSVQGNTLRGENVVADAADALLQTEGTLADRLLAALEAGGAAGGDKRCDADNPARSAFLIVAQPGDEEPSLNLHADPFIGGNALESLREKYETGGGCSHSGVGPSAIALIALAATRMQRRS